MPYLAMIPQAGGRVTVLAPAEDDNDALRKKTSRMKYFYGISVSACRRTLFRAS
jgi:hypothetical protein